MARTPALIRRAGLWSSGAEKRPASVRSRLIRPSLGNETALRLWPILRLGLLGLRGSLGVRRDASCLFLSHGNPFRVGSGDHQ